MIRPVGDLFDREVARLYTEEGKTSRQIAKLVGYSHVTVIKKLRKMGVAIRPQARPRVRDTRLPHNSAFVASDMLATAIERHHPERMRR